eukprot:TRINITY_DN69917_c0_g1_i1.p1 TRINITY_DN69917_c0_g1~~TRINITY_DN69917_c0_g1_i1.p1  ORF type:complete len:114 (-),score=22.92 TRINITY_DN69917_c0_g1_i1:203-544(-)
MVSDWQRLQNKLKERFGSEMDHDSILFMIGLQELDKPYRKYKKDEKLEVMHIGVCTVLQSYGFYEYKGRDDDDWPHWELKESLPALDAKQQNKLMSDALVDYFKSTGFLEESA